ncbi:MAG: type transport system permease protein [Microbacteriaceae bacterium]|jgi:ABC-2 type transport system permease protein|nr:type transport system permease protein [Microbacteriaceae bacterium]
MVAQFLRLKLRLLANILRRSPMQIVGVILGLLYGIGLTIVVVTVLFALRIVDVELARSIVVTLGSVVVLGYLLVPLAFGVDDTLDPRKFALFGIPSARLANGLALAALIGVPSIAITIISFAQIVTWSRGVLPVFLAIVSAVVIAATCVLGARVTTALAALLLASRRARESTGLIALLAVVSLSPLVAVLASVDWGTDGEIVLARLADVLGWTPLGAAWASPADAAAGDVGAAFLKALIGLAFAGILWLAWRVLVAIMLVSPEREAQVRREPGLGWFGKMPASPAGAIAARSLTYWFRDSRYRISLVMIPIVPGLMIVPLYTAGVFWQDLALIPVPVMCLFLTWSIHNDVAYDNSAIWLHLASNTSGWADRFGRAVPALMLGVPLVIVGSPICAAIYGDWRVLPSLIGVGLCILLSGIGLSSIMSARFPYPAVRPGDGPFMQPQSSGTVAALAQSLSFFAIILISLPSVALGALGLLFGIGWHIASLIVGSTIGVIMFFLGLGLGSRIFERRGPELLAFTLQN